MLPLTIKEMKLEINLDSSSLSAASCIRDYKYTTIGDVLKPDEGAYVSVPDSVMVYGVAVHKFIDTMYKTGEIGLARRASLAAFNVHKISDDKKLWLDDSKHLFVTCSDVWMDFIQEDTVFDVLSVQQKCWKCSGKGLHNDVRYPIPTDSSWPIVTPCSKCNGIGLIEGPATEITFHIRLYEDDVIIVYLCGTIDRIGKFRNGPFAIRDWKSTTFWMEDEFLSEFAMSRQLRIYTLACKLMAELEPQSILGKIGVTNMGAMIDAIFVKKEPNENKYISSPIMQFGTKDMNEFREQLHRFCSKLSIHIQHNDFPREGILNGTCVKRFGKCRFFNVCKASNEIIATNLLKRDFKRKIYDPLNFH